MSRIKSGRENIHNQELHLCKRSRPKSGCLVYKADRRTPEFRLFSVSMPICEVNNMSLMEAEKAVHFIECKHEVFS